MERSSQGSVGRKPRHYRITVRGEVSQKLVEPLEQVVVESTGDESILSCEVVDQAKLQAVFSWLYARGVEILSVVPDDDDDADSVDPHSGQHRPPAGNSPA
jgi:hypothetical protein